MRDPVTARAGSSKIAVIQEVWPAFQARRYGRMQASTKSRVHVEVTFFSVSYAFDFR
jgi:hypothetical protein